MWRFIGKEPIRGKSSFAFKIEYSFDTRKLESQKILGKYPERVPIIVEKSKQSDLPELTKNKYLVNNNITVGNLLYIIRQDAKIKEFEGVFLFINDSILPPLSEKIGTLYEKYKDLDGFLYICYTSETVFG